MSKCAFCFLKDLCGINLILFECQIGLWKLKYEIILVSKRFLASNRFLKVKIWHYFGPLNMHVTFIWSLFPIKYEFYWHVWCQITFERIKAIFWLSWIYLMLNNFQRLMWCHILTFKNLFNFNKILTSKLMLHAPFRN